MRRITTGYCIGPVLKAGIMEKIKREGLTIVVNDDPIDWYKRTYCLPPAKTNHRCFSRQNHQLNLTPALAGQTA